MPRNKRQTFKFVNFLTRHFHRYELLMINETEAAEIGMPQTLLNQIINKARIFLKIQIREEREKL